MHFSSGINCPPYESADGYLQTTEGCSHNHCLFCTYFKDKKFKKSPIEQIEADIKVDGNRATQRGRSRVNAAVFGGGRHTWRLQLSFELVKHDGRWQFTSASASTY